MRMSELLGKVRVPTDFLQEGSCLIWISHAFSFLVFSLIILLTDRTRPYPTQLRMTRFGFLFVFCMLWYYSRKREFQVVLDVRFSKQCCYARPLSSDQGCASGALRFRFPHRPMLSWRSQAGITPEGTEALIFLVKYIFLKNNIGD